MELLKELMMITEGKKDSAVSLPATKPRAKQVNDVLRSKKGGRMKSASDYDRNAAKRETRKALSESDDGSYFWYEYSEEIKDHGGDGRPDERLHHRDGIMKAASKEDAIAKVKKLHKGAFDVRVGPSTKAEYDKYWND